MVQWKSWDRIVKMLYVRENLFWQRQYTVSWMKRYLPPNAVAVIIKDHMAHRDWWAADVEARWLAKEQRDHDKLVEPRPTPVDPESWADNPVLVAAGERLDAEHADRMLTPADYGYPEKVLQVRTRKPSGEVTKIPGNRFSRSYNAAIAKKV